MTLSRINQIIATRHRVKEASLFKTEYTTTTPNEPVDIAIKPGLTYNFNYRVDGGSWINHTSDTLTINIPTAGVHTIDFDHKNGGLPGWYQNNSGEKLKLTKITQFGDNQWQELRRAFWGCQNLVCTATDEIDVSQCDNLESIFRDCYVLGQVVTTNWILTLCTTLDSAFSSTNITTLDVSNWVFPNCSVMASIFFQCNDLITLDVSNWDVSGVDNWANSFFNCLVLAALDVSGFDMSNSTIIQGMLRGIPDDIVDISNWVLSSCTTGVNFLKNSKVTTAVYDAFWIKQDSLTLQSGVTFEGGTSTCTPAGAGETARASVIANDLWTVIDGDIF